MLSNDFCTFVKKRTKMSVHKSGGIIVCVKRSIGNYVKHINNKSKFVLWIQIDKHLLGTEKDGLLGAVYLPPEGSVYYRDM